MTVVFSRMPFQGKRVLIVESEFLLPISFYRAIETLGGQVMGPVAFPEDVLMLVKGNRPDVAIVDAALNGYDREAVLGLLRRMHVPFAQTCRETICARGDGCFPLSEEESALRVLGESLSA